MPRGNAGAVGAHAARSQRRRMTALRMSAQGKRNAEIALRLGIGQQQVARYLAEGKEEKEEEK